jgi:glycosyltransferase involved in cell wall biosynthesis
MTAIESMSVGCPTIFTKRTTGPEIINNKKDGLLVDPDDINEIAKAICFMIENRVEAIAMGALGRNRVNREFSISKVVEKHLVFYKQVLLNSIIIESNGSNK